MGGIFTVDGQGSAPMASVVNVAPGFFATIRGRVVAGREFSDADLASTEPLAIVNDDFARHFGDPVTLVGRHLTGARVQTPPRIIGVVRGLRFGAASGPHPQIFRPSRAPRALTIVARVQGAAADRIAAVRCSVGGSEDSRLQHQDDGRKAR